MRTLIRTYLYYTCTVKIYTAAATAAAAAATARRVWSAVYNNIMIYYTIHERFHELC